MDTDNDGMPDLWEVAHQLNPVEDDADKDADGDKINNFSEFILSQESYSDTIDTDNDGMPDLWEVAHQLNPVEDDATKDADNDGESNLEEFLAQTDPQNNADAQFFLVDFNDAINLGGYYWRYEGQGQWKAFPGLGRQGGGRWRAWNTPYGQETKASTIVNSPGGKVSFYVEVWGDTLTFLIDGKVQGSWNTTVQQRKVEFDLPIGRHELAWVYSQKKTQHHGSNSVSVEKLYISALPDSDNDGVTDGWEYTYFENLETDFNTYDKALDQDNDGLTDIEEALAYSNPFKADSDQDGMPDLWEVTNKTDPGRYDRNEDADGDKINNFSEFILSQGNYSDTIDTDNDGMPDLWEVAHQLNPVEDDADKDADGDGTSNLEEFRTQTDPQIKVILSIKRLTLIKTVTWGASIGVMKDRVSGKLFLVLVGKEAVVGGHGILLMARKLRPVLL
ncbi:hypothetical protein [Zooshikella ganghwensis]|nr:hypothetical protein [Zooshikella ganghwensis]